MSYNIQEMVMQWCLKQFLMGKSKTRILAQTHNESQLKLLPVIQTSLYHPQSSVTEEPVKVSNGNDGNIVAQITRIHYIEPPLA